MQKQKLGNRGYLFTFEPGDSPWQYPASVYVISGDKRVYICDTHTGPRSMDGIIQHIQENDPNKEIVVFNSHSHWDHWWGNSAFPNAKIIAHTRCKEFIQEQARSMLGCHAEERNGDVKVLPPNTVFSDRLSFEDDGVLFLHTPGHSEDSCSCIDLKEQIAYIGDLVEEPIPYLEWHELNTYEETLINLASLGLNYFIAGHTGVVSPAAFSATLKYLDQMRTGKKVFFEDKATQEQHIINLRSIAISRIEQDARVAMGSRFNYDDYWCYLESLNTLPLEELQNKLSRFAKSSSFDAH
jgi:cyclase